ncbi:MAG: IS200/IS605 family transposase [Salinivirgaceae bacterium]|jgi:putative transposase|nr:IS200/IS605 family transposase [Salinivirgaceae bacterium]
MGQSLSKLYVHLTFGTKGRKPYINTEAEEKLHAYIKGILDNFDSPSIIINSVPDHIHILFRLSKNHALAKVIEEVKKSSSKWFKEQEGVDYEFKWQIGYGAFSVSSSKVDVVKNYIKKQKVHHSTRTYKDEIEEFIREYDVIEYDENYFWD